jgi:pimeloyl-ACP methyl ester carboxylesterase
MTTTEPQQTRSGAYLDAGGVHTYYEVTGGGDPLLLLHGGMCTAETCDAQVPALAEQYRVFVPERRGHGRTPDVEGPLTYSIMADDTIAFIEALGIGPALVVGFSDGGAVALLVALRRPDLVRKLVLIGQGANSDGAAPETRAMMESLSADVLPPMLKALYAAVSPDGPDHFEAVFEMLKRRGWAATTSKSPSSRVSRRPRSCCSAIVTCSRSSMPPRCNARCQTASSRSCRGRATACRGTGPTSSTGCCWTS